MFFAVDCVVDTREELLPKAKLVAGGYVGFPARRRTLQLRGALKPPYWRIRVFALDFTPSIEVCCCIHLKFLRILPGCTNPCRTRERNLKTCPFPTKDNHV